MVTDLGPRPRERHRGGDALRDGDLPPERANSPFRGTAVSWRADHPWSNVPINPIPPKSASHGSVAVKCARRDLNPHVR